MISIIKDRLRNMHQDKQCPICDNKYPDLVIEDIVFYRCSCGCEYGDSALIEINIQISSKSVAGL